MDVEIGVINPMDIFKLQASNVIYKGQHKYCLDIL